MIEVLDCEQGSEEWLRARMGIPTGSEFAVVLSPRAGKEGKGRKTYLYKLAGEILTGEPMDSYTNAHFERGKEMEAEARAYYAFRHDVELTRVGFIKDTALNTGVSPDSLIGANGALEIKTALAHLLIECLLKGDFPPVHKAQCQGVLWLTGREWIDLAVYWPSLPLFVTRAHRDEDYIRELAKAVAEFNDELAETVARVKRYGAPSTLKADLAASVEIIDHDVMMQQAMRPR